MFVDRVKIFVSAGDGGRGCVSFRREPYVPWGGPDGGRGGKGGDVVLLAVSHQNTLLPLRYHTEFHADDGGHGGSSDKTGRRGEDRLIAVPPGTRAVDDATGTFLGELLVEGERLVVARGGRGGRGNRAFLSNRNRAPREAELGYPGEERWLRLDLRLIADAGLIGLPNAGKSTLLSRVSAARPKIGDYPFTTLTPVLGVVEVDDDSLILADIPGIIEGAHAGAGLGLRFLSHVQRARALVYVVDASGTSGRSAATDLVILRREVALWDATLLERPQIVVASKRDAVVAGAEDPLAELHRLASRLGLDVVPVSSMTGAGLPALMRLILLAVRHPPASGVGEPGRGQELDGAQRGNGER